MINLKTLQAIAREVRAINGIERTPEQIYKWLKANVRHPNSFAAKVLFDPEGLENMAERMKIPYYEKDT